MEEQKTVHKTFRLPAQLLKRIESSNGKKGLSSKIRDLLEAALLQELEVMGLLREKKTFETNLLIALQENNKQIRAIGVNFNLLMKELGQTQYHVYPHHLKETIEAIETLMPFIINATSAMKTLAQKME